MTCHCVLFSDHGYMSHCNWGDFVGEPIKIQSRHLVHPLLEVSFTVAIGFGCRAAVVVVVSAEDGQSTLRTAHLKFHLHDEWTRISGVSM
jgi:hypothetical protein